MSRVLFWDIETSPIIAACWGLYDQNISYHHVIQDWHIICAAWKWADEDEIQSITCKGKDDKRVVRKLSALFQSADAIVAHNGDRFDWRKFMARSIQHGIVPPRQPTMIDTLKMARKAQFTSNKLDDLAAVMDLPRKQETERGLWVKAAQGDADSIAKMEEYCKADIPPLKASICGCDHISKRRTTRGCSRIGRAALLVAGIR